MRNRSGARAAADEQSQLIQRIFTLRSLLRRSSGSAAIPASEIEPELATLWAALACHDAPGQRRWTRQPLELGGTLVDADGRCSPCCVLDASGGGFGGRTDAPPAPGAIVDLVLRPDRQRWYAFGCRVAWVDPASGELGLALEPGQAPREGAQGREASRSSTRRPPASPLRPSHRPAPPRRKASL